MQLHLGFLAAVAIIFCGLFAPFALSQEKAKPVEAAPTTKPAPAAAAEKEKAAPVVEKSLPPAAKEIAKPAAKTEPASDSKAPAAKAEEKNAPKKGDEKADKTDKTDSSKEDKHEDKKDPQKEIGTTVEKSGNAPSKTGPSLAEILNRGDFPSPQQPDFPMRARNPANQKLIHEAYSYVKRLDVNIRIFRDRLQREKVEELKPEEVAITQVVNVRVLRIAETLLIRKEPAAVDLALHGRVNSGVLNGVAKAISSQPGFPLDRVRIDADKLSKANDKRRPALEAAIKANRLEEVDLELQQMAEKLEFHLIWLLPTERSKYKAIFGALSPMYSSKWAEFQHAEVKKQLTELLRGVSQEDFDLVVQIEKARAELSRGAETTFHGKTVSGPQLIDTVRDAWLRLQPRVTKITCYSYLLQKGGSVDGSLIPETAKNYSKFCGDVLAAIAGIVESDLIDCKPEEVPELYKQYLASASALQAQLALPSSSNKIEEALEKLAKKNDKFEKQVRDYKLATQPLLDWRMKLTNEQAALQTEDMPNVANMARTAFRNDAKTGGFVNSSDPTFFDVITPVLPTVRRRSLRLLNRSVACSWVVTNPADAATMICLYDDSCLGVVPAPKNMAVLKKEIDFLKADLLVDDKNPPLSFTAATAIWKAEHGYWTAVGADVKNFLFEPSHSMVLAIPDDEPFFTPLGRLPAVAALGHLMMRYDFADPYWVRGEYFFCDLGLE